MSIKKWFADLLPQPVMEPAAVPEPVAAPEPVVVVVKEKKPRKPRQPKVAKKELTAKEIATAKGEPFVTVLTVSLDLDNPSDGSFDLDWNEIFVARLVKAGYKGKTDIEIVDQWFNSICRNVLAESWEQHIADPSNRNQDYP